MMSRYEQVASGSEAHHGRVRYGLTAAFALLVVIWASSFLEGWKRRAKVLALDWGALDDALAAVAKEHVKFSEDAMRRGFYTADGLWVDLSADTQSAPPGRGRSKVWRPTAEDAELLGASHTSRWSSASRRMRRVSVSVAVVVLMGLACVLTITAIMVLRLWFVRRGYSTVYVAIINAAAIEVFNSVWRHIALALTSWENHRLEKRFRDALVFKMFAFQFINCYFSFFYLAFFRRHDGTLFGLARSANLATDRCGGLDCMYQLRQQLLISLLFNFVVGTANETLRPVRKAAITKLKACLKRASRRVDVEPEADEVRLDAIAAKRRQKERLTPAEERLYEQNELIVDIVAQYDLPELKAVEFGLSPTFYEFNELALQFGYIVLFSAALPAAAGLALLNNLLELRLDSVKVLKLTRRVPATSDSKGIGAWRSILLFLTYVGLGTNLGILIYTSDWFERFYPSFTPLDKLLLVVVLEHALIGLKLLIDACVPDMPAGVRIALAREEWLADQRVARNDQRSTTEGSLGETQ